MGTESVSEAAPSSAPINIIVKNFVGGETGAYAFLDKKIRITATSNCTVQEIKEKITEKFPGYPPSCIQRLFFTNRLLRDEDVLGNITTMPSLVLTLDIISGTTVYQKTVSVSQALEAYVSTLVHQAYIGSLLSNDDDSGNSSTTYNFVKYRKMFDQINATIYEKYADDIAYALEKEKNPETITADTVAWRGKGKNISPLKAALAKEFDMNGKGLVNMIRFSITMAVSVLLLSTVELILTLLFT